MATKERKMPKVYNGVVSRRSGDKTVRVVMSYLTKHEKYGKMLKRRTTALVHDEQNQAGIGDKVAIVKCRPYSKLKFWRLVKVVEKA